MSRLLQCALIISVFFTIGCSYVDRRYWVQSGIEVEGQYERSFDLTAEPRSFGESDVNLILNEVLTPTGPAKCRTHEEEWEDYLPYVFWKEIIEVPLGAVLIVLYPVIVPVGIACEIAGSDWGHASPLKAAVFGVPVIVFDCFNIFQRTWVFKGPYPSGDEKKRPTGARRATEWKKFTSILRRPVANVLVQVVCAKHDFSWETETDAKGKFHINLGDVARKLGEKVPFDIHKPYYENISLKVTARIEGNEIKASTEINLRALY
jgi:hypothetical protein